MPLNRTTAEVLAEALAARPAGSPEAPTASRGKLRLSGSGAHWFDRQTGLNILIQEIVVPASRWSRAPRYVSVALTNACELKCAYCYAPKIPATLDGSRVLSWLRDLDGAGCLGVGFGGGEPTAHRQFAWICRQAAECTDLAVTFTTHGHRIDDALAAELRGSVHFIRVSMDGLGPVYERLRGRPFASFRRRLEVIATIAPFGLNVVVNDDTVGQLDEIAAFVREVGGAELLLLPEQPAAGRSGISRRAAARMTEWVSTSHPGTRLAISRAGVTEGMPLADPFAAEPVVDAYAHIDARGCLKKHSYARDGVVVGGSIMEAVDELRRCP